MIESLAQSRLVKRKAGSKATKRKVDLLEWAKENRPFLIPGRAFDLANHAFLVEPYKVCTDAPSVTFLKASQVGISELMLSDALYGCDVLGATSLYVFPTDTHVSDFSMARLGPAIQASDYLAELVVSAEKKGADRVTLKRIRDRFLYFRGAQIKPDGRSTSLKSIDADRIFADELDEWDKRALEIARKRIGHSSIGHERLASTPTYPGIGVHDQWQQTDMRRWFLRCERCNEWQYLTIDHFVQSWDSLDRPIEYSADPLCEQCDRPLNRLAAGEWVAEKPEVDRVGYQITKLFSPFADIAKIIGKLKSVDESVRKEVYNQDLAEVYTPKGAGITDDVLDACRREPGQRRGRAFMGIDVGRVLHIIVRQEEATETGERMQLLAQTATWDEAKAIIDRYNPATVVIDALPETTKARELQAACRPGQVWLSYYRETSKDEEPTKWNRDERIVLSDRTRTLDATYGRFADNTNTLPVNVRDIADYYKQLKAPVRRLESTKTGDVVRYVENGADHYAHAENYCTIASMRPAVVQTPTTGGNRAIVAVAPSPTGQQSAARTLPAMVGRGRR